MAKKIPEKILPRASSGKNEGYGARHPFEIFYALTTEAPPGAFPLWTGEWIHNCATTYPAFWAKAIKYKNEGKIRVISDAQYEKEISAPDISAGNAENATQFGQTGAFVIDEVNGHLRLPKITGFIQSIATVADQSKPQLDAIRNITGNVGDINAGAMSPESFSGAIFNDPTANGIKYNTTTNIPGQGFGFDASRVVPVASENRPKNVRVALFIQVYNPDLADTDTAQEIASDLAAIQSIKNEMLAQIAALQNELVTVRQETAAASLPDMSRAVLLEETDYSMNDNGCIFKVNVPGWLVPSDRRVSYDAEYDWSYTVAPNPGALFYGADTGLYGYWARPTYNNIRHSPAGMVNGGWRTNFAHPIVPSTQFYFTLDDASSVNYTKKLWFVPSMSVPSNINPKDFVTRVGKKYLSPNRNNVTECPEPSDLYYKLCYHSNEYKWTDNFVKNADGTMRLDASGKWILNDGWIIKQIFGLTLGQGSEGANGWDAGQAYWLTNTMLTGKNRVWWRNAGYYIIRYITSAEIDAVIAEILAGGYAAYIDYAYNRTYKQNTCRGWLEDCRDKWVCCNWQCYRKEFLAAGSLGYDGGGIDAWSYWQNILFVSQEAGLNAPPLGHGNKYMQGYALDVMTQRLPSVNWTGVAAKSWTADVGCGGITYPAS